MIRTFYLSAFFALLLLGSCTQQGKVSRMGIANDTIEDVVENIVLNYARLLSLKESPDQVEATIIDPWDSTRILQRIVVEKKKKNAAVFILPHCGLLDSLGCGEYYTNLSDIITPDPEQIIDMDADVIFVSPFENSGGYGAIEKLGIDIIQCADYMESTPLGRAEWMKFYGRLFGQGEKADSLFDVIERNYNRLKDAVQEKTTRRPKVTCDLITGSTWYVPGGNSTFGHLIEDAGGTYIYRERYQNGSLALSPETVFEKSEEADIWLMRYSQETDMTYSQLGSESPHYSRLKAFKTRKVYGCNLSKVPFFEETPFHPDLILDDLIKVMKGEYGSKYFKRLE